MRKAAQNDSTPEQEMQHMMEHNHVASWMQEIRRNKALGVIVADATVTDTDGNPVDVVGRAAAAAAAADAEAEVVTEVVTEVAAEVDTQA